MKKIAVIGQGYVGLPLSIAFSYHFPVIGYDLIKRYRMLRRRVAYIMSGDSSCLVEGTSIGY